MRAAKSLPWPSSESRRLLLSCSCQTVLMEISQPVVIPDRFASHLIERSGSASPQPLDFTEINSVLKCSQSGFRPRFGNSTDLSPGRRSDVKEGAG